ncbi:hypothetical protein TIFTF001_031646 [Ficus carica]|uniref:Uncharacterized protein n=1 Tax=Ficus carica TaxID=3494 RepID=A0AA88DV44_FICCA|nr:hypothetical protein TIFTF001_031646 [Ficus carica]
MQLHSLSIARFDVACSRSPRIRHCNFGGKVVTTLGKRGRRENDGLHYCLLRLRPLAALNMISRGG